MYVKNPEKFPKEKLFSCNETIANWLIYKGKIPLLAKSKGGKTYYFVKTEELNLALNSLPLLLNIIRKFG